MRVVRVQILEIFFSLNLLLVLYYYTYIHFNKLYKLKLHCYIYKLDLHIEFTEIYINLHTCKISSSIK